MPHWPISLPNSLKFDLKELYEAFSCPAGKQSRLKKHAKYFGCILAYCGNCLTISGSILKAKLINLIWNCSFCQPTQGKKNGEDANPSYLNSWFSMTIQNKISWTRILGCSTLLPKLSFPLQKITHSSLPVDDRKTSLHISFLDALWLTCLLSPVLMQQLEL